MWLSKITKLYLIITIIIKITNAESHIAEHMFKNNTCPNPDDFQCDSGICITFSYRCNGKYDCPDKSDEEDCAALQCLPPDFYKCKTDDICIETKAVCDGTPDCDDGEDETDCKDGVQKITQRDCDPENEFKCDNEECIPLDLACNGKNNCLDGSDEKRGCEIEITKPCTGFTCNNKRCLRDMSWVCDGKDDCGDNSDEHHCIVECTIEHKHYLCHDNNTCITVEKVCDGVNDCPDGSDEGGQCKTSNCTTIKCPNQCHSLPTGPVCLCSTGFEYNHTTQECEDVNECHIYGICSQECENTIGSYKCRCVDKFKLNVDGRTCIPFGDALMIYSTYKSIGAWYIKARYRYYVAKDLTDVVGVDFDGVHIYWTDLSSKVEAIYRAKEDGTKIESILSSGIAAPESIRVDWLTGNIYFTDSFYAHIAVCSNDGFHCTSLIYENIQRPRGLVLNPNVGDLYWTDWGDKPMIGKASMDGKNQRPFVSENLHWPNCLCLDWPNERIYWVDAKLKTIESVDMYGLSRKVIIDKTLKHPYGIAVFDDRIYWSDWFSKNIQSCNKFTGKDREIVIKNKQVYDIHIYHIGLMPHKQYPCTNNYCSHLCLVNSNNSYACACPKGMVLGSDASTCRDTEKEVLLAVGIGNSLALCRPQAFGRHDSSFGENYPFYVSKIVYNTINGHLFVADNVQRIIYMVNLATKEYQIIVDKEIGNVSGMAFDYLANNLYWTDSERLIIGVYSMEKFYRTILPYSLGSETPIAIAVVPEIGSMFIALRSNGVTHIDKISLDGRGGHHHLFEDSLGSNGEFSLTVDYSKNAIFWGDQGGHRIESTNFEGDVRHIVQNNKEFNPVSVAVINDFIFWSSYESNQLYYTNKSDPRKVKKATVTVSPISKTKPIHLAAVSPLKLSDHICTRINGGCSHICISNGKYTSSCLCPSGMTFKDFKEKICVNDKDCEYRCKSGECLPERKKCDGIIDCSDKSDEESCLKNTTLLECSFGQFRCNDQLKCIEQNSRCDHHSDCNDGSDEHDCDKINNITKCHKSQFACPNGLCLDVQARCDGFDDCGDHFDEKNCFNNKNIKCGDDFFTCQSGQCIKKEWVCDLSNDCTDGSDEHNLCPYHPCPDGFKKCANRACIDMKLVCDGHNDCGDHSDEVGCLNKISKCNNETNFECSSNNLCLPLKVRCNGTAECPRGEDERNCTGCHSNEFECNNKRCIMKQFVCDNDDDCLDGSDESNCDKNGSSITGRIQTTFEKCSSDMFDCKDGQCIEVDLVCDGNKDCYNGLDESGMCNISCIDHPCEQICVKSPFGPSCKCNHGFKLSGDHKTCVDINECREFRLNPCAQKCFNTVGSFRCSCFADFMLKNDKRSCKAFGDSEYLLYSTFNQLRKITNNPITLSLVQSLNDTKITGVDVNVHKNLAYFTSSYLGTIFQHNMTSDEFIYISKVGNPGKIAVDWITNNIYFVDNYAVPMIKICHIGHRSCARIIELKIRDTVTAIAVDPINKFVFYSSIHLWLFDKPDSALYRTNLDGTRQQAIAQNFEHISTVAYDVNKKVVYFTDMKSRSLFSIDYDGKHLRTISASDPALVQPISMNIFEDHARIMNSDTSVMANCALFGDGGCFKYDMNDFNIDHIVIVQKTRQKIDRNICHESKCTNICVPTGVGPKCLCSDGVHVEPGANCGTKSLHEGGFGSDKGYVEEHKSSSTAVIVLIIVFIALVLSIGTYIYYRKKYQHGKFNISMHFQNPILSNIDSAQVKMVNNPPEIVCSKHRTEVHLQGTGKLPVSYNETPQTGEFGRIRKNCENFFSSLANRSSTNIRLSTARIDNDLSLVDADENDDNPHKKLIY